MNTRATKTANKLSKPISKNEVSTNWYILKTKSNCEKKVLNILIQAGFVSYLPLYQTIRVWSDRKKKIEVPLIPSFVFVNCVPKELIVAAKTEGVAWIMRDIKDYAIVKDYEIENLRIFLSHDFKNDTENTVDFKEGEAVKVTNGPFSGLIGTALEKQGEFRIRIEINAIAANFSVSISKSQLQKI